MYIDFMSSKWVYPYGPGLALLAACALPVCCITTNPIAFCNIPKIKKQGRLLGWGLNSILLLWLGLQLVEPRNWETHPRVSTRRWQVRVRKFLPNCSCTCVCVWSNYRRSPGMSQKNEVWSLCQNLIKFMISETLFLLNTVDCTCNEGCAQPRRLQKNRR